MFNPWFYTPPAIDRWSRKRRLKWIRRARKNDEMVKHVVKKMAEQSPFLNLIMNMNGPLF